MASATEASDQANRAGLDPKRLVVIFYLLSGIVLALFSANILESVWAQLGWNNPQILEGLGEWRITSLVGLLLAIGVVAFCNLNPRIRQLSMETSSELMKVTWPSWADVKVSTLAVVVASVVAAAILFSIDWLALRVFVEWLPALWGKL